MGPCGEPAATAGSVAVNGGNTSLVHQATPPRQVGEPVLVRRSFRAKKLQLHARQVNGCLFMCIAPCCGCVLVLCAIFLGTRDAQFAAIGQRAAKKRAAASHRTTCGKSVAWKLRFKPLPRVRSTARWRDVFFARPDLSVASSEHAAETHRLVLNMRMIPYSCSRSWGQGKRRLLGSPDQNLPIGS